MKQETHHHLVLLFTNTCFLKRQFPEKNSKPAETPKHCPLEYSRWINTVLEILPDLCDHDAIGKPSSAWEIVTTKKFIQIKIGSASPPHEEKICFTPSLFPSEKNLN